MSILVILEQRGQLRKCALEAASASAKLAQASGKELHGVLLGKSVQNFVGDLAGLGIKKVHLLEDSSLEHFSNDAYVPLIKDLAAQIGAELVIGSASILGKELCASLAGTLNAELVQDCVAIEWDNGFRVRKPVYGGKVLSQVKLEAAPTVISLRPNFFPVEKTGSANPETEIRTVGAPNIRAVVQSFLQETAGQIDLSEAKIIVSGGRGMGGPEGVKLVQGLSQALHGAMGASRAAVDAGWISQSHQVGQTGKVVNPDVYIACGISGSIQHQAGMRTSKIVVAINKDPDANIFKICDYGIVGDMMQIVPLLTQEIGKAL